MSCTVTKLVASPALRPSLSLSVPEIPLFLKLVTRFASHPASRGDFTLPGKEADDERGIEDTYCRTRASWGFCCPPKQDSSLQESYS